MGQQPPGTQILSQVKMYTAAGFGVRRGAKLKENNLTVTQKNNMKFVQ